MKKTVIIIRIKSRAHPDLFEIVQALDLFGLFFGLTQGGQQHAGKNRDDSDDDKEFDKSETTRVRPWGTKYNRFHNKPMLKTATVDGG